MKTSTLILTIVGGAAAAVLAAYIISRMGWNGDGGSGGNESYTVTPTTPAGYSVTGGYIPGRVDSQVMYN